jgi:FMN phosphatase YigB (HAD superfamily)
MGSSLDYRIKAHALLTATAAGFQLAGGRVRHALASSKTYDKVLAITGNGTFEWDSVVKPYDVVSIDVFDTLISRLVLNPEAVHVVVAREAFDDEQRRTGWPPARLFAEHRARASATRPDVRLTEIYSHVPAIATGVNAASLQAKELATELRLARPTRRGQALWKAAHAAGKSIVIATDIYLPRTFIEELLRSCGYDGWSALYVSGDDGTAKYDGTTFARLAGDFAGRRVLHIGDNLRSDVAAAKASGVEALHLRRPLERSRVESTRAARYIDRRLRRRPDDVTALQQSILGSLTESWLDNGVAPRTPLEQIGYRVLGPALVGFSQYLEQEARARSLSRIVFLAREGAMLKRAFDSHTTSTNVQTTYAILSTRSLGVASLSTSLTESDLQFLTKSPVAITARQYIARVLPDIDHERIDALLLECGVQPEQRLTSDAAVIELRSAFHHLLPELGDLATAQRDATISYLHSLGIQDAKTAMVDVGWQGTIQRAVSDLIGSPVTGVYWGLRRTELTSAMRGIDAWVDQRRGGADARLFSTLYWFSSAFEVLLANTASGSAAGVRFQKPKAGFGGEYAFTFLPLEFNQTDRDSIQAVQDAAIQFVEDFGALRGTFDAEALTLTRGVAHQQLVRLLTRPSIDQFNALKPISFDGTYGVSPQPLGNWWIPPKVPRRR